MTYVQIERPEQAVQPDDDLAEHETSAAVPVEVDEPASESTRTESDRRPGRASAMTREKVIGGLSIAAIAVGGLHHAAGIPGLIAGGAAATAGGVAFVAHRYGKTRSGRSRAENRTGTASHATSGGRASRRGKNASTASAFPSLAGGRASRSGKRGKGLSFGGGSDRPAKSRRDRTKNSTGNTGNGGTGGGPKARGARNRSGQFAGAARRAARWADNRTNHRLSRAWAARPRLAQLRERARARDEEMASGLRALLTKIRHWLRLPARPTDNAPASDNSQTTDKPTPDTPPADKPRPAPQAAPTSARPATRTGIRITERSTTMSGNPLVVVSAELIPAAASWATEDMMVVAHGLDSLGQWPYYNATALGTLTGRLVEEYPIDGVVIEALRELYTEQSKLITRANEIGPLFRRVHRVDIDRREKPRRGERKWNL
ncbi:hypothetical protein [Nonomuraea recticatena]|uniref:Uncharacterized protein n=1 Tax=Nonomuraea recticatena TaxID=46178 RepID=A0ABN3T2C2_9ACTN